MKLEKLKKPALKASRMETIVVGIMAIIWPFSILPKTEPSLLMFVLNMAASIQPAALKGTTKADFKKSIRIREDIPLSNLFSKEVYTK